MGVFDEIRCKYKLPLPEAQDFVFQTKDTDEQYCGMYEIREDGTLWHEAYDYRHENNPESPFGFYMHRDNRRWEQEEYAGQLSMYHLVGDGDDRKFYTFLLWFKDGVVRDVISLVEDKESRAKCFPNRGLE